MNEHKRHERVFRFVRMILLPFAKLLYNFEYQDLSGIEGPYLLLSNHNSDVDPIFIAGATKKHIYFVATENITRMGIIGKFFVTFFHPIIHYKGKIGINTVKEILKTLKSGYNVALFPEGNRSFNGLTNTDIITPSTGKMAKKSGASLVTFRIDGAYLSTPRWSRSRRKGKVTARVVNVYTPDMLKSMTEDEVNDAIKRDLYVDAYSVQESDLTEYKGKNLAEYIESTVFSCPSCGKIGTLSSHGSNIQCGCGFKGFYDEYGYVNSGTEKYTVTELDRKQKLSLKKLFESSTADTELFSDKISLLSIGQDHKVKSAEEKLLSGFRDRLRIGERDFFFDNISGLSINQRNTLIIHYSGVEGEEFYNIQGPGPFSALKYLYLYNLAG